MDRNSKFTSEAIPFAKLYAPFKPILLLSFICNSRDFNLGTLVKSKPKQQADFVSTSDLYEIIKLNCYNVLKLVKFDIFWKKPCLSTFKES